MATRLFLVAYTVSGLAGLVYEVSWTRLLTRVLGHGLAASSTVLAAFMGGLALGAFVAGRMSVGSTARRALQAYAVLEAVVIVLALLLPVVLAGLTPFFAATYHDGQGGVGFGMARVAACTLLLLPPAMALGATFPLAVRYGARDPGETGVIAGRLYACNTVGAGLGAVVSGFVLLPAIGVTATSWVGAAASGVALLVAIVILRGSSVADGAVPLPDGDTTAPRADTRTPSTGRRETARARPQPWLAASVLTLTGLVTLTAEIAWTRVFSLIIGPSTYAFAATVAVFIGGLAAGALVGTGISGRMRHHALALGVTLGIAAVALAWATMAAGIWLPRRVMIDFAAARDGGLLVTHALLAGLVIAPASIAIGAAFPIALQLAGGGATASRRIGAIYALNTIASVAGSLLTGFVMIPWVGLERTLHVAALLLVVASAAALMYSGARRAVLIVSAVPLLATVLPVAAGTAWDRELLASGSYKYASDVPAGLDVETALRAGALVYYKDGPTGTVSVKRLTGQLSLAIDGKVDASSGGDMLTQKLLAHVPLLLHDSPRDVAIIGLGSGVTLASALTHPVTSVDTLEISPEVAEASRLFTPDGASPLDDPRSRLVVADGRTHLALTTRQYDVIVSEPSNPWMAGVAALFTREFFAAARTRLAAGGIMCQWVNTYDISAADLQSVVATFASVFPHATLWLVGEGDLLVLGSAEPFEPRFDLVAQTWQRPGVAADLQPLAIAEPFGVLSTYLGGDAAIARFHGAAPLQTDDRMALEFSAPRALRTATRRDNVDRLRAASPVDEWPPAIARAWAAADARALAHRATMLQRAGAFDAAYRSALDAATRAPDLADALTAVVESAVALGRQADAVTALNRLIAQHPAVAEPRLAVSRLHAASGALAPAASAATDALELDPRRPEALEQLASVFADAGDASRLAPLVAAMGRQPERPGSAYYAAALAFLRGDLAAAERAAGDALRLDPRHARARNLLGAVQATRGETAAARETFSAALLIDPRDPATYQNLGLLELSAGRPQLAARLFAEALSLDPASPAARDGLARATAQRP